ncbi:Defensin-like protein 1 [Triticum urartu]|uniref:Defensin-like protein 1 n=1 Tax=Triticum urartu TaxID=4572 RepID=M7YW52_TRIUA|nr:defensin-like protein [Triticum dicoccoides]XP_044448933.1 defensin-like protein [Triticum aestivum]XP_048557581.1 defensin-like protein [Triticum urartu]EMS51832.1 Defensin-like protein 1 [Triticum urartu]
MAVSSKLFPAAVLLLLLLLATEMGPVREAMACEHARCKKCTGACFDPDECAITCRNEGYDSGDCTGSGAYRCTCSKNC